MFGQFRIAGALARRLRGDIAEMSSGPDYEAIKTARRRIQPWIRTTPLVESDELNAQLGGRLLVKLESLQRGGAFKIRGAISALTALPDADRKRGVIAFSSGNHAIAVATAARLLGTSAVIVMPADAPRVKLERTRQNGAEVVTYDRATEDREKVCADIAQSRGLTLIPPFDHPMVIAGQGTIALEIAEQAKALDAVPEALIVPTSGGGLAAGCAIVAAELMPQMAIIAAEPDGFDDMARSLDGGAIVENAWASGSICDALLVKSPGALTLPILRRANAKGVTISDADALAAMKVALETFKVLVEPGGAAALAAVLTGKVPIEGRTIAVICSGGNADTEILQRALAGQG